MTKRMRRILIAAALASSAFSAQAGADSARRLPFIPAENCFQDPALADGGSPAVPAPRLLDGLGHSGLEPDSDDPQARAWFAQGVRLVWAFDEVEAIRAFQQAQRLDPDCALCFFGEAWARSPTINLQPRTEELPAARASAQKALALAGSLGPRDRALVQAMAIRTAPGDAFSQEAYAAFVEKAARRHKKDPTLAILAADARMQLSDRMEPGSLSQRLLEGVLARQPDHGGAIHFYIHLTDWIDRQHLAVPFAERLGRIAPAASHLVHMPSHSFFGVGRYQEAAAVNVQAIAADQAFGTAIGAASSDYRRGLLGHNMHFAMNAALARGDGATALAVADQYRRTFMTGVIDNRTRLLGTSLFYAGGLHGEIEPLLARPLPEHALDQALFFYARGEAQARRGDHRAVTAEADKLARLRQGELAPALGPAGTALAAIFHKVLEGRAAMMRGDHKAAERAYREGMEAQGAAGFGSDPPLFWYPVRRSLAAAMLKAGDAEGARRQLLATVRKWPNDPLSLYLLSRADAAAGDEKSAARNLERARRGWFGDVTQIPIERI